MSDAPMAKSQDADAGLWWVVLAAGIVTSLFAIAIMAWPDITLGILTALLGIELIVAGVLDLVRVFAAKGENAGARWFMGVVGAVALGIGLWILFGGEDLGDSLKNTVQIIGIIVGIFWVARGAVDILSAITDSEATNRGMRMVSGALWAIAGVVVVSWPGKSLLMLTWIVGLSLLLLGILQIVLSLQVKKALEQSS